ncbi:uncharacterized protein LOC116936991 isoform X2 [Petromyzon marinus]|uniref:uncharacterized protein LOC116936991 isoform X2 n=1 Tax=Petromyzon marinus TaxID=7757 RepID=UPI003F6FA669
MVERHHVVILTLLLYTWFVDAEDNGGSCIERASSKAVALFRAQDLSKCSLRTADDLTASVAAIVNLPRDMDRQYLRVRSLSQKEDAFLNYTKSLIDSVDKLVDQSSLSLWEALTESSRLSLAGQLLASVEKSSFLLAINLHSRASLPLERRNLVLEVVVVEATKNVTFSTPQVNLSLASPASKTRGGRNRVAFALYRDLSAILTVAGNATPADPRSTTTSSSSSSSSSSLRSARDTHGDTDGHGDTRRDGDRHMGGVSVVSAVVSAALETSPAGGGGGVGGGGGTTLARVREESTQLETPVVFTLRHSEAVSHPRVSPPCLPVSLSPCLPPVSLSPCLSPRVSPCLSVSHRVSLGGVSPPCLPVSPPHVSLTVSLSPCLPRRCLPPVSLSPCLTPVSPRVSPPCLSPVSLSPCLSHRVSLTVSP